MKIPQFQTSQNIQGVLCFLMMLICFVSIGTIPIKAQDGFRSTIRGFSYEVTVGKVLIVSIDNSYSDTKSYLKVGDVINKIDGIEIKDDELAVKQLSQMPAGYAIMVKWLLKRKK